MADPSRNSKSMSFTRLTFLSAAIVNALIAGLLFAMPGPMYESMVNGPAPENAAGIMYLFGPAVAIFGLGYYWVSRDFHKNRQLAVLAVYGKLGVFLVAIIAAIIGAVSVSGLAGTLIDLTYGLLFAYTLKENPPVAT